MKSRGGVYLLDVAYPIPNVVKGLLVGDVVHQHDALQCRPGSDIINTGSDADFGLKNLGLPWLLCSRQW